MPPRPPSKPKKPRRPRTANNSPHPSRNHFPGGPSGPGGGSGGGHQKTPRDPNDISGPAGYGPAGFVNVEQTLPYVIGFVNEPSATAPAQVVRITEQLDTSLDWSTFQLGSFGFGGQSFAVPAGLQHYQTRLDERSTLGLFVDVAADFNPDTGALTWTFTSLDPTTLDQTGNPLAGFLPPDVTSPQGEGFVSYSVLPKASDPTGRPINAQATVVFDTENPINTPQIVNTIDAETPTSSVNPLPASSPSGFTVSWAGQDGAGSGVGSYDGYVSDNGGAYTLWLTGTTQTSATFTGQDGHSYGFYSVATSNVGNVQPTPTAAQATTTVDAVPPTSSVAALPAYTAATRFTVAWSGSDNTGGSGIASYDVYVSDNGGPFTPFQAATAATSATFPGQDGHRYAFYSVATDLAGNRQATPTAAQASTLVDVTPPDSSVNPLPSVTGTPRFTVSWSGGDTPGGSGLRSFDVFVSVDGGAFTPWLIGTTTTSATYAGDFGHTYGFSSVAVDNAGNRQPMPAAAQATTTVPPRTVQATLVRVRLAKRRKRLDVRVFYADDGQLIQEFAAPFQAPRFRNVQVSVRDNRQVVVTAQRGKRSFTQTFPV